MKVLYARNLLLSTTEDTIEQVFSKFGDVERVKKIKDYSFIHFRTKEQARAALEAMNGNKSFMFMFCGSITFQQVGEGLLKLVNTFPAVGQRKPASFLCTRINCFLLSIVGFNVKFHTSLPNFCFAGAAKKSPGGQNFSCEAACQCFVSIKLLIVSFTFRGKKNTFKML